MRSTKVALGVEIKPGLLKLVDEAVDQSSTAAERKTVEIKTDRLNLRPMRSTKAV